MIDDIEQIANELQQLYAAGDMTIPFIRVYTHNENPNIPMGSRVVVHVVMENWLAQIIRPKRKTAESEYVTV